MNANFIPLPVVFLATSVSIYLVVAGYVIFSAEKDACIEERSQVSARLRFTRACRASVVAAYWPLFVDWKGCRKRRELLKP
jgi:hypothetical protein